MKIRLDQPVHSTDGPFGDFADVVVDPRTNTVTHIIVEPRRRHFQARLVPLSLIDFAEGVVNVRLDEAHLRSLQRVAESEFVPIYQPIDLGDEWDVGTDHIVALPYEYGDSYVPDLYPDPEWSDPSIVDFDRIPRGECEIRRESHVVTTDHHQVGLVAGMIVDGNHVEGVYVETGLIGFRHLVALPIMAVGKVRNDQITLNIDKKAFRHLSPVGEPFGSAAPRRAGVEHRAAKLAKRTGVALRSALGRR